MRIAILDMDDLKNPHWGSGAAKVTREIGKRLAKKHQVTVFASKYPKYRDYKEDNIEYKHIGLQTDKPQLNNLGYIAALPLTVPKIDADIIVENFTAPISTCCTPLYAKVPVVGLSTFYSAEQLSKKYHLPFESIEKAGSKAYKYFIALNQGHEQKMKQYNKKAKVILIPNGIDDELFTRKTFEDNYLLYIGRIDVYGKGLDLLIKSFARIKDQIKEDLYIMGAGSTTDEKILINFIEKHKLQKRVKLLGKLSGEKKNKIFASAKIVVFPSRYEGQSLSALESLALGKPFVCFDIPGFDWLNDDYTLKAKTEDERDFAEKVKHLLTDSDLRKKLSKKCRELSKKYTWDKGAEKYESFLENIIANKV